MHQIRRPNPKLIASMDVADVMGEEEIRKSPYGDFMSFGIPQGTLEKQDLQEEEKLTWA